MTKEELIAKREDANKKFNSIAAEVEKLSIEMNRLQGEYRAYEALISSFQEDNIQEATTIVAKEDKKDGK